MEADAVGSAGRKAVEAGIGGAVIVRILAEGLVGILGEGVGNSREINGLFERAIPAGGTWLFVGEIGSAGCGGIGGDDALVDDSDRIVGVVIPVVAAADGAGVAADGDPAADRESLVGSAAADGAEAVGVGSSEDEVTSSGDGLCTPLEGDSSTGEGAAVADADFCVVESQAVADRDGACRNVEVAGERDAGEGAAAPRHHECRAVGADESGAYDRATEENDIPRGVDLRDIRDASERDRGARAGVADDSRVNGRWQDISIPIDGIEEVCPGPVSTAIPSNDRQHGTPLEPLHADKCSWPESARGNTMLASASAAAPREKSSVERPRAGETAHRRNPEGRVEKDP